MNKRQNSVALVTGGAGALGTAIVSRFRSEKVIVIAAVARIPERPLPEVRYVVCDMTDSNAVTRLFDDILAEHGAIDHVAHAVGGFVPGGPIAGTTISDWDMMMQLNLRTAFLCTREALRAMSSNRAGHIVLISALSGLEPRPGRGAYAISKAAVNLLMELSAAESGDSGITVNAIAPEILDTPANRENMPDADPSGWVSTEAVAEQVIRFCMGEDADVNGRIIRMDARH